MIKRVKKEINHEVDRSDFETFDLLYEVHEISVKRLFMHAA